MPPVPVFVSDPSAHPMGLNVLLWGRTSSSLSEAFLGEKREVALCSLPTRVGSWQTLGAVTALGSGLEGG